MTSKLSDLPPRLHCDGARLIKPNGKPITLRGINLGAVGEDLPEDAEQIAATGANCVRVALRWWGLHGDPNVDSRDNDGFAFLLRRNVDDWIGKITAASAAGLWVIPFIDSNCGQCGMQDAATVAYCDPHHSWGARGRNFFTDASMRRVFAQIVWPAAAARLRAIAKIALLELQPELAPQGLDDATAAAVVRNFYGDVIEGVRGVDADTPILVGARNGYDIRLAREAFLEGRSDIVYTGNLLNQWVVDSDKFADGLAALVALRDECDVPVFVQQLGRKTGNDRNLVHMRGALETMAANDVGYTWWQWKQNGTSPDDYGLNYKASGGGWAQKTDEVATLTQAWA
jgi:Cellulase (glycosyl hydrolase family 5)